MVIFHGKMLVHQRVNVSENLRKGGAVAVGSQGQLTSRMTNDVAAVVQPVRQIMWLGAGFSGEDQGCRDNRTEKKRLII